MNLLWFLQNNSDAQANSNLAKDLRNSRLLLLATFTTVISFGCWAYFAKLDQVTRAPGSVIPTSRTQVIQSQDGGVLEELLVAEGDEVLSGQEIARIEPTRARTEYLEARARAASLSATVTRLKAETFGEEPEFSREYEDYPEFRKNELTLLNKRQSALAEEVAALQEILSLVRQELKINRPLLEFGDVSLTEILRLERQEAELKAQITNTRNKYFQDAQAELTKTEAELERMTQLLEQRKRQLEQTVLIAPVAGIVKNIRITTLGGVFRAGDEVMQIVPVEDDLLIEAKVSPADIGFLHPGQNAQVKIDAYDYSIFGALEGELTYISADTLEERRPQGEFPYYRVHILTTGRTLKGKRDEALQIQPGMTATVEIKTGSRTVLNYIFKPIVKTLSESLGER